MGPKTKNRPESPGRLLKGSCTMRNHRRLLPRIIVIVRIRVKIIVIWK
jgi:hypothetical protein